MKRQAEIYAFRAFFPKQEVGRVGGRCGFAGYNFAFCRDASPEGWARIECRNTSKLHLKPGTKPAA